METCPVDLFHSFIELPCWVKHCLIWTNQQQGLIGGILALAAALWSMLIIGEHRKDSIQRKNVSDRAGMPRALSEIIAYSKQSVEYVNELFELWTANHAARPFHPENRCPEYPIDAFNKVQSVIEHATKNDSKILHKFIALSQVQFSRLQSLEGDLNRTNQQVGHIIFNEEYFHTLIFDAMGILQFSNRIFEYARLQCDNIGSLCTAEEVNNKLAVSFGIRNQSLSQLVERRWPPSI